MKDAILKIQTLILTQRIMWWLFLLLFGLVTGLYLAGSTLAEPIAYWSIAGILAATFIRLVVMAELMRRAHLYRYWLLCFLLAAVLIVAMLIKS